MNCLKRLSAEELNDLYSAENQLVKALPKMAEAANSPELRAGAEAGEESATNQIEIAPSKEPSSN